MHSLHRRHSRQPSYCSGSSSPSISRIGWPWCRAQARGVRSLKLHAARHTFASLALEARKPVRWTADQPGHANPELTLRVYVRARASERAGRPGLRRLFGSPGRPYTAPAFDADPEDTNAPGLRQTRFNELAHLHSDSRPAGGARDRCPLKREGLPMPSGHGVGLDQDESVLPAAPRAPECTPQDSLFPLPAWPTHGLLQQGDLLTKGEVLEHELRARAAQGRRLWNRSVSTRFRAFMGGEADADAAAVSKEQFLRSLWIAPRVAIRNAE